MLLVMPSSPSPGRAQREVLTPGSKALSAPKPMFAAYCHNSAPYEMPGWMTMIDSCTGMGSATSVALVRAMGKHATKGAAYPGGKGGACSDGGKTVWAQCITETHS